jgi:hypothetical protein
MPSRTRILCAALTLIGAALATACAPAKKAEPPRTVGTPEHVAATLELIKATRIADPEFLANHGILRDNLARLENLANALAQAPDNDRIRALFNTAFNECINRADIIARRPTETDAAKARAKEIQDNLVAIRGK